MPAEISEIISQIKKNLSKSSEFIEAGLADDSNPEERFLQAEADGSGVRIDIASDGLDLNHKIALEQLLLEGHSESASVRINFKRLTGARPVLQGNHGGPVPIQAPKTGPFGFPIQKRAIPGVSKVVAVSSGKGGVGKSTISANLVVSLAKKGYKVGLLDADIYGPSAPLMLGLRGPMPVAEGNKIVPLENYGVKCVSFGFMTDGTSPVIWRGPMVAKALKQLFYETKWDNLDYLIIDLPPGTGDVQMTMIEQLPLHAGIIVSTPQNVALLDAHKGLTMFRKLKVPILGIVENMSHFTCRMCGHEEAIFGSGVQDFASDLDVPVIARIPLESKIRQAADEGAPIALSDTFLGSYYSNLADLVVSGTRQ